MVHMVNLYMVFASYSIYGDTMVRGNLQAKISLTEAIPTDAELMGHMMDDDDNMSLLISDDDDSWEHDGMMFGYDNPEMFEE